MFKIGTTYTHKRMLDAAVYVLHSVLTSTGYFLRVRWVKRNGLDLNRIDEVWIKREELKNWYVI